MFLRFGERSTEIGKRARLNNKKRYEICIKEKLTSAHLVDASFSAPSSLFLKNVSDSVSNCLHFHRGIVYSEKKNARVTPRCSHTQALNRGYWITQVNVDAWMRSGQNS